MPDAAQMRKQIRAMVKELQFNATYPMLSTGRTLDQAMDKIMNIIERSYHGE